MRILGCGSRAFLWRMWSRSIIDTCACTRRISEQFNRNAKLVAAANAVSVKPCLTLWWSPEKKYCLSSGLVWPASTSVCRASTSVWLAATSVWPDSDNALAAASYPSQLPPCRCDVWFRLWNRLNQAVHLGFESTRLGVQQILLSSPQLGASSLICG